MKHNITKKVLNGYSKKFNKRRTNKVFKNVNTKTDFKNLVIKSDYMQNKKRIFKNYIDIDTKITNQKNSGRCWIFAFLNTMRIPMIKKYKLDPDFEFSQSYLFFYDKLEKANYFFNYIFNTKNKSINNYKSPKYDDIKLIHMLDSTTTDGGDWNMFANLIEKYGIMPKSNMDDQFHSKKSHELGIFLNNFLRKSAKKIRDSNENKDKLLHELLYDCYKILVIFLGEPPKKFTWEYYENNENKNGKKNKNENKNKNSKKNKKGKMSRKNNETKIHKVIENITPIDFYKKYVPYNAKDKIVLLNYPCKEAPYYKVYDIELTYNIFNDKRENFINVPIDVLNSVVKKSIDNEEAVWSGVDIKKFISNDDGFLDPNGFNYKDIFGFNNIMEKCDSLNYRQSWPNHAIILRGYNFEKGKTNGYLVENSWGEDTGFKGNYYMSQEWFNKFVYYIVVDKKYVSKKILNASKQKPIKLPFWSPFGALL